MNSIRKILAPTDLSNLSCTGVRYALELAKALEAEVTLYHVVNVNEIVRYHRHFDGEAITGDFHRPGDIIEEYKTALARFLAVHFSDLTPWVKIREKVDLGLPEKNIVEEAIKEDSDLIVIATHGRTGFSHLMMGSVTEKVVRYAPCPVLSINACPIDEPKIESMAAHHA